jgi:hypothetical protein
MVKINKNSKTQNKNLHPIILKPDLGREREREREE